MYDEMTIPHSYIASSNHDGPVRACPTMTAEVSEVQIDDGFVVASFAGLELIVKEQIGFVNATHLCRLKNMKLHRYDESHQRRKLNFQLTSLCTVVSQQVTAIQDPRLSGTYFHPLLLLDLATWLAPETYVGAAAIIDAFFARTDQRKCQLRMLFSCDQIAAYQKHSTSWLIRYSSFDLRVDERGWFKVSDFYYAHGKSVDDFESQENNAALLQHFRVAGQSRDDYYHPLLFLRLAAWVRPELYVKSACVVFNCGAESLNALFRREIATASASSNLRFAKTSGQNGGSASKKSDDEADETLTRREHEEALDRLRRQFEWQLAQERLEKKKALARLEKEKRDAEDRERAKDVVVAELQRRLKDLRK